MTELRLAGPGEDAIPLMELARRRVGLLRAGKLMAFVIAWGVVRDQVDGFDALPITEQVATYREWWRANERTTWRELALWRQAFPEEPTPSRALDLLAEHRTSNVGALPVAIA